MIHPVPPGTRDVLPDEMRELRALSARVLSTWQEAGYGEVWTPTLEFEEVMRRGDDRTAAAGFRTFDDQGHVLTLRADGTIPIARLVANRYEHAEGPLRLCYFAHAYRAVKIRSGQPREFLQGGIELVGSPSPDGTIECLTVLCAALDAAGLEGYRVGLGDASLYPALLDAVGVDGEARAGVLHELYTQDFAGLERKVGALELDADAADLLVSLPQVRGEVDVLDGLAGCPADAALASVRAVIDRLEPGVRERILVDLGLARALGYYTGAVFEVYDPALGVPLGGGGRYDDLLGRFGRPLPAVGFALNVERLHIALMGEERR
jgi:ATP phosphoribosyltransferase regulatory subunit